MSINKELDDVFMFPDGTERFTPLIGMLELVAMKKKMERDECARWVEEVRFNFADVGVVTINDFLCAVLTINSKLQTAGHPALELTTLSMMMKEISDLWMGTEHVGKG